MGEKGGGNTPPDSELRNLAIPLPELRKPVANAIQEANQQFKRGGADPWQFGPGVVQPWNDQQNAGYLAGAAAAGNVGNILNPSANLVSNVGGGSMVGNSPGQGTLEGYSGGNWVGAGPGQDLLNRFGAGEFIGGSPGQGTLNSLSGGGFVGNAPGQAQLNQLAGGGFVGQGPGQNTMRQFAQGGFVGNAPGQGTLNRIGAGEFARPGVPAYDQILNDSLTGGFGIDEITGTARGDMLNGNPHLDALIKSQSRDITRNYGDAVAGIEGRVSGAGRLGSNAEMELQGRAQQNLGQELGDLETRTRYQDYGSERGYQQQAQLALPGARSTEIGTQLGAANARAGDEWQALQTMLSGANAAGQGYRADQGLQLAGAQGASDALARDIGMQGQFAGQAGQGYRSDLGLQGQFASQAGQLYQNSQAQALQGAGMAGDSMRADRGQQIGAAQAAGQGYRDSVGQALGAAGMAPGQAAAQFMAPDALMRYGGAAQNQAQTQAQENQDRQRYGQEAEWQNLQRYLQSLQGAGGLANPNAGGLGLNMQQGPDGTTQTIGNLATLAGTAALFACDQRIKTDVERLGDLATGAGLYRYRYLWDEPGTVRVGPMAQELAEVQPEAVANIGGVLMVDMARLEV